MRQICDISAVGHKIPHNQSEVSADRLYIHIYHTYSRHFLAVARLGTKVVGAKLSELIDIYRSCPTYRESSGTYKSINDPLETLFSEHFEPRAVNRALSPFTIDPRSCPLTPDYTLPYRKVVEVLRVSIRDQLSRTCLTSLTFHTNLPGALLSEKPLIVATSGLDNSSCHSRIASVSLSSSTLGFPAVLGLCARRASPT